MDNLEEKRATKALERISWSLKRIAWVLESSVKLNGEVRAAERGCQRCGSFLWVPPKVAPPGTSAVETPGECAVCDLPVAEPTAPRP